MLVVPAVVIIALAPNMWLFFAGWMWAGIAQSAVLYQAAFAAVTGWYGPRRVRVLTTLTLAAGLASTIFAPLTSYLLHHFDWRATYLLLAAVLAVVTIPAHLFLLTPPWHPGHQAASTPRASHHRRRRLGQHALRHPRRLLRRTHHASHSGRAVEGIAVGSAVGSYPVMLAISAVLIASATVAAALRTRPRLGPRATHRT